MSAICEEEMEIYSRIWDAGADFGIDAPAALVNAFSSASR